MKELDASGSLSSSHRQGWPYVCSSSSSLSHFVLLGARFVFDNSLCVSMCVSVDICVYLCAYVCVCARVCVCAHMRLFRGSRHPFLHLHGARLYFRHSVCCVPSLQFADHWRLSPPLPWGLIFFQRETLEFSRFHSRPLTQITNLGLAEQLLSWSRYYFLDFFSHCGGLCPYSAPPSRCTRGVRRRDG